MDLQVFGISYFDKNAKFGTIELDGMLSQDITLENILSEHPLEDGQLLNDAIHNKPIMITITAIVSDLPQSFVEQAKQLLKTNVSTLLGNKTVANSKSLRAWADLIDLWKKKQLIQIKSPLQFEPFEDMAIMKIKASPEDNYSLTFTAELKQVLLSRNIEKLKPALEVGKQSVRK